jgi:catechol 2,3-dioxygenase-like lactoylglutathione lyase family enzyme
MKVRRLNHAVLRVRDLDRSLAFYADVLGLEPIARMGNAMAFMRAPGSQNHHDLGLARVGPNAPRRTSGASVSNISLGKSTRSKRYAKRATHSSATAGSPAPATTAQRNRSTVTIPTETSSKSCGWSRANAGVSTSARHPLASSTSKPK